MNTAQPIRNPHELKTFRNYYLDVDDNPRNYLLIVLGLNTALRISDLLQLKWKDVYDEQTKKFCRHITITEQKTKKASYICLNKSCLAALQKYRHFLEDSQQIREDAYLFLGRNQNALSRSQAWRIIKHAASCCKIEGVTSPHSLRKTFGYTAWKSGTSPTLLMMIFNHSSFEVTKRYLGIMQDDRDMVFQGNCL